MARPPARLGILTSFGAAPRSPPVPSGPSGALHTGGPWCADYRTKRVGFVVTFRLAGAEKSVLKLVGANLKDGQNVLVLW